jgi:hypothetical protein
MEKCFIVLTTPEDILENRSKRERKQTDIQKA